MKKKKKKEIQIDKIVNMLMKLSDKKLQNIIQIISILVNGDYNNNSDAKNWESL